MILCVLQEDILSIWNKTASDQVTTSRIRDTLRRVLNLPPNTIMEYKTHNDSLKYAHTHTHTQTVYLCICLWSDYFSLSQGQLQLPQHKDCCVTTTHHQEDAFPLYNIPSVFFPSDVKIINKCLWVKLCVLRFVKCMLNLCLREVYMKKPLCITDAQYENNHIQL